MVLAEVGLDIGLQKQTHKKPVDQIIEMKRKYIHIFGIQSIELLNSEFIAFGAQSATKDAKISQT